MKTIHSLRVAVVASLYVVALEAVSAPGDVVRISNSATTLTYGNNYSYTFPSGVNHVSADGRFVAFYSQATNLVSADTYSGPRNPDNNLRCALS